MAQTFDYRDIYNDYMAAKNPDMSMAGDAFAGDKNGYQKYLQNTFQTKYGIDPTQELDLSAFAPKASAATLLNTGGNNNRSVMDPAFRAMQLLQAKKYDPNAEIRQDGDVQSLFFDRSKLPKFLGGDPSQYSKMGGLQDLTTNNNFERVLDKSKVLHDPNYGDFTLPSNLRQAANDGSGGFMGQLGKYMPGVISSIMGAATGGALTPGLLNGVISATEGGGYGGLLGMLKNLGMNFAAGYVPGGSTALSAYKLAQLAKSMGR